MSVAEWYKQALKEIEEDYSKKAREINRERFDKLNALENERWEKSVSCVHKWLLIRGLFYGNGESHDGYQCSECLAKRGLYQTLNEIGHS